MADTIKIKPYKMPTIKITRLSNGVPINSEYKSVTYNRDGVFQILPTPPYNALDGVSITVNTNKPLQAKNVSIFERTTIVPDQGYSGLSQVVATPITEEKVSYATAIYGNISGHIVTLVHTGRIIEHSEGLFFEWKMPLGADVYYTKKENPNSGDALYVYNSIHFLPTYSVYSVDGRNIPEITQSGRYTFEPTQGKLLSKVSVDVKVNGSGLIPVYSATRKLADNDRDLLIGIPDYIDNLSQYSLRLFRKRFVKNKRARGQESLYPRYALNHWHEVWHGRPYVDSNRVFTPEIGNLVFKKDGISYYRVIFRAIGDSNPDNLPANSFINSYTTPLVRSTGSNVLCKELMVHGTWGLCLVRQSLIQSEFAVFKVNPVNSLVSIGV